MIRVAVSVLLLALVATAQEPTAQPSLVPAVPIAQQPTSAPSCTDDSVTADQMAAGACTCPASESAPAIVAEFKWEGGSGSFDINSDYASIFNWWSSKFCHQYGVATIPLRDKEGNLVKVNGEVQTVKIKLPRDKWTMQLWYTHNLATLVTPLNKACAADADCSSKIPSVKAAREKLRKAQEEADAADREAALTALQPKVN